MIQNRRNVNGRKGRQLGLALLALCLMAFGGLPAGSAIMSEGDGIIIDLGLHCYGGLSYSGDFPYTSTGSSGGNSFAEMAPDGTGIAHAAAPRNQDAWATGWVFSHGFTVSEGVTLYAHGSGAGQATASMGNIGHGGHSASAALAVGFYSSTDGVQASDIDSVAYNGGIGENSQPVAGEGSHGQWLEPGPVYYMTALGTAGASSANQATATMDFPFEVYGLSLCTHANASGRLAWDELITWVDSAPSDALTIA